MLIFGVKMCFSNNFSLYINNSSTLSIPRRNLGGFLYSRFHPTCAHVLSPLKLAVYHGNPEVKGTVLVFLHEKV